MFHGAISSPAPRVTTPGSHIFEPARGPNNRNAQTVSRKRKNMLFQLLAESSARFNEASANLFTFNDWRLFSEENVFSLEGQWSVLEVKNIFNKLLQHSGHSLLHSSRWPVEAFVRCLLRAFPKSSLLHSFFHSRCRCVGVRGVVARVVQVESCISPLPVGVRSGKKREEIPPINRMINGASFVCSFFSEIPCECENAEKIKIKMVANTASDL